MIKQNFSGKTTNIIIAENELRTRYYLKHVFNGSDQYNILKEINIDNLFTISSAYNPDIIIIGIQNFYEIDAIEIKNRFPTTPILLLIEKPYINWIYQFYSAGIEGIGDKTAQCSLYEATKLLLNGENYIQPNLSRYLIEYTESNYLQEIQLTYREHRILQMIIKGLKCWEIAKRINTSRRTISDIRQNILSKLNINSINELKQHYINKSN